MVIKGDTSSVDYSSDDGLLALPRCEGAFKGCPFHLVFVTVDRLPW